MITKLFNKIRTIIELMRRNLMLKSTLDKLRNDSDEDIKRFLFIINSIRTDNKWTVEENDTFNKINDIRNQYNNTHDSVRIKDFGSGYPDSKLTDEQMHAGIDQVSTISKVYRGASINHKFGKLIFQIIRNYKPANCLELGTALGVSALYQIFALKLNNSGRLISVEGSEELASIAQNHLKETHCNNYSIKTGRFMDVLSTVLSEKDPIDFAFIDGHHDRIATKKYFELIYANSAKKCIVVFDDIMWSKGMKEVWREIYQDKRVKLSFDIFRWGICVIDKEYINDELRFYKIIV